MGRQGLRRPVQHIYPLEVWTKTTEMSADMAALGEPAPSDAPPTDPNSPPPDVVPSTAPEPERRPVRASARLARDRILGTYVSD